jgi:uncharacterized protein YneF (UPF0154 family)
MLPIIVIVGIFVGVTCYTFGYDNGFYFALKMAKLRLTENGELVNEDCDG